MNSSERHELRYQRRFEKRQRKKGLLNQQYDNYEKVFSYNNLYQAYKKSKCNVAWKASVQKNIIEAPIVINYLYNKLKQEKFKSRGFYEFDIHERGKERHIKSVTFGERIVQRCLCDNSLIPIIKRSLIYDNSATLQFRGYHFAIKRLCKFLKQHYQKYGNNGYILIFDFRKYFDNISHNLCKKILAKNIKDKKILNLTYQFIDNFSGDKGLGLGSQISQILAVAAANKLDHFIKQQLRVKMYGRYMDDGFLIHSDKQKLKEYLIEIKKICKDLGIILNQKKTQIIKLSRGFNYLKTRIFLTKTGKIIKKAPYKTISKERKKLKTFARKMNQGKMTQQNIYASWQSWRAYAKNFNNWQAIQNVGKLYNKLFITPYLIDYWEKISLVKEV